jgi:hypothetical protein
VPYDGYGPAVEDCTEDAAGRLWVGNGEYSSWVRFCPFCGREGKPPPTKDRPFGAQESCLATGKEYVP